MIVQNTTTVASVVFVIAVIGGCVDQGADLPAPSVVPVITRVSPESLRVSEMAKIEGHGFETYEPSYAIVFSNNVPASIYLEWTDTEIKCIVPPGAISGPVRVRKGELISNEYTVFVVGTQPTQLILSQTSVSLSIGQSTDITISGGVGPYTIQTAPNSSIATASINGSTLTVSGAGQGTTSVVIADASAPNPLTATLTIEVTAPPAGVSFSQQIIPIFTANCVGCHGGTANLFLTSSQAYDNLVNVPAQTGSCAGVMRVAPGNSSQSALYLRVNGMCSERMPQGGSLSQNEIDLIRSWIDQGALNN